MGMDYQYAGSASYPRFDRELCAVAEVLGGVKSEYLKERERIDRKDRINYWFGFLSSDSSDMDKFVFPEGTNETIIKWFNCIYRDDFTVEETKTVWEHISRHLEIKEISSQIWYELEMLVEMNESWSID